MKTVVITGGTRGIGYGLAANFLRRGCQVVISGRNSEAVNKAVAQLAQQSEPGRVAGFTCEISDYAQVQALWDAAASRFGKIDIWINNAGQGNTLTPFWELDPQKIRSVVESNVIGAMYGSSVAIKGMLKQGEGALYNMEGYGSRGGRRITGLALYGTTKAALAHLDDALIDELKDTPIRFGILSPGMVVTDLLLNQRKRGNAADWERSKRAFNILADRVETVTPWLVEQILNNDQKVRRIAWLNGQKVMLRFLTAPFTKRQVID